MKGHISTEVDDEQAYELARRFDAFREHLNEHIDGVEIEFGIEFAEDDIGSIEDTAADGVRTLLEDGTRDHFELVEPTSDRGPIPSEEYLAVIDAVRERQLVTLRVYHKMLVDDPRSKFVDASDTDGERNELQDMVHELRSLGHLTNKNRSWKTTYESDAEYEREAVNRVES